MRRGEQRLGLWHVRPGWNIIMVQGAVLHRTIRAKAQVFGHHRAERLRHAALGLPAALDRVQHCAGIRGVDALQDVDFVHPAFTTIRKPCTLNEIGRGDASALRTTERAEANSLANVTVSSPHNAASSIGGTPHPAIPMRARRRGPAAPPPPVLSPAWPRPRRCCRKHQCHGRSGWYPIGAGGRVPVWCQVPWPQPGDAPWTCHSRTAPCRHAGRSSRLARDGGGTRPGRPLLRRGLIATAGESGFHHVRANLPRL